MLLLIWQGGPSGLKPGKAKLVSLKGPCFLVQAWIRFCSGPPALAGKIQDFFFLSCGRKSSKPRRNSIRGGDSAEVGKRVICFPPPLRQVQTPKMPNDAGFKVGGAGCVISKWEEISIRMYIAQLIGEALEFSSKPPLIFSLMHPLRDALKNISLLEGIQELVE